MSSNIQSSVSNSNRTHCHCPSTTNAIATAEAIGPHHCNQMNFITATTDCMVSALPTTMAITIETITSESTGTYSITDSVSNVDSKGKDDEKLPTNATTEITAATVANADSTASIVKVKTEPNDEEDKQDQKQTHNKPNDLLNRTTTTDSTHNPEQRLIQTLQNEKEHLQNQCSIYETNHTQISTQNVQLKSTIHDYQHTIKLLQEKNVSLMNQVNNLMNQWRYAMRNWCEDVERLKEIQFRYGLLWQNFNWLNQVLEARNTATSTNDTLFGNVNAASSSNDNAVDGNTYTPIISSAQDENSLDMKQDETKKKSTEDKSDTVITNADPSSNNNIIHFLQPRVAVMNKDSVHPTGDKTKEDKKSDEIPASSTYSAAVSSTKPSVKVSPKPKTSLTLGEATTPQVTSASQVNTPSVMNPPPFPGVTPSPPICVHPNNNPTIVNGHTLFLKPPSHNNHYHVSENKQQLMSPYSSSYHAMSSYPGQPLQNRAHCGFYPRTYPNQKKDMQACVGPSSLSSPSHFTIVQQATEQRPLSSRNTSIIQGNQCKEVGKVNHSCNGQKKRKVATNSKSGKRKRLL